MSNNAKMAGELNKFFSENDLKWKRADQTYFIPTNEDFEDALAKVREALYDQEDGTQLEFGRLIVRKDYGGHIDVYVHLGELD